MKANLGYVNPGVAVMHYQKTVHVTPAISKVIESTSEKLVQNLGETNKPAFKNLVYSGSGDTKSSKFVGLNLDIKA